MRFRFDNQPVKAKIAERDRQGGGDRIAVCVSADTERDLEAVVGSDKFDLIGTAKHVADGAGPAAWPQFSRSPIL